MTETEPQFAVCIHNEGYPVSLERRKLYQVLPDEEAAQVNELRVIDESGEDYLFPAAWFCLVELPHAVEDALLVVA